MQAPIFLFMQDHRQRAVVMRDLAALNRPLRSFDSGAALTAATHGEQPALVLWDLDEGRPRGGLKQLVARLGSAVIGLTSTREHCDGSEGGNADHVTLLLPYARWRVGPVAERLLRGQVAPAARRERQSPRVLADTVRQVPPRFDDAPAPAPRTLPPLPMPASPTPSEARARVLVASQDEVLQHILRYQLEALSCDVQTSGDGVEALGLALAGAADVLLVDLDLPFLNAFEILEQLNAAPRRPRVVIMSEQMHDDKVVRAFNLGAADFVHRPLNPRVIASRIRRLVRSG